MSSNDQQQRQHQHQQKEIQVQVQEDDQTVGQHHHEDHYTTSWEPKMARLIYSQMKQQREEQLLSSSSSSSFAQESPFLVALVGIPGSGKSTSSRILSNLLQLQIEKNETPSDMKKNTNRESGSSVLVMPMDGYHLPISTLRSMPNSKELIYKRGSPETFDPKALLRDLKRIRGDNRSGSKSGSDSFAQNERIIETERTEKRRGVKEAGTATEDERIVHIPGFDHSQGDPQPNTYTFQRYQHSFVICEGLYLLYQDDDNADNNTYGDEKDLQTGWNDEIHRQFDLTIFINADVDSCIKRLKIRNKCIPGYTPQEIDIRCDEVDRANAMLVLKTKDRALHVVESVVA